MNKLDPLMLLLLIVAIMLAILVGKFWYEVIMASGLPDWAKYMILR